MISRETWHREADEKSLALLRRKVDEDAKLGIYEDMPTYWKLWGRGHPGELPPGVPYWYWKFVPVEVLPKFSMYVIHQKMQTGVNYFGIGWAEGLGEKDLVVPDEAYPLPKVLDILWDYYWAPKIRPLTREYVKGPGGLGVAKLVSESLSREEGEGDYDIQDHFTILLETQSKEDAEALFSWSSPSHRE